MTLRRTRKICIHRLFGVPNEKPYKGPHKHIKYVSGKYKRTVTVAKIRGWVRMCPARLFHFIMLAILLIVHTGTCDPVEVC